MELEQQNPTEEPVHQQDQISGPPTRTRPTPRKGGTPARLGYYDNYLVDNHSCVIVGVQATAARMSQETVAAQDMLDPFRRVARTSAPIAGKPTRPTGTVSSLQWLADRSITPYIRTRAQHPPKEESILRPRAFHLRSGTQSLYSRPAGQSLNYGGRVYRNRAFNYIGTRKKCGPCSLRPQCTSAAFRGLIIHQNATRLTTGAGVGQHARVHQKHSGKERRWRPCSRNSKIRSDCGACVCGDSGPCASSSSWQLSPRTSSDSFASSVSRHHRFCWPPLSRTETREPATACAHMKGVLFRDFFNTHA